MFRALFLLLDTQYVQGPSGIVYQCLRGGGIGLKHSPVVTNILFYILVEREMPILSSTSVVHYSRYHDDICIITESRFTLRSVFGEMCNKCGNIFKVKCESVHSAPSAFIFLDLLVRFQLPRVSVCASQGKPVTPLCPSSAHSWSVHGGWPKGVRNRICRLSSSNPASLALLRHRYEMANTHPVTLNLFNEELVEKPCQPVQRVGSTATLVLRYHPVFRLAVSRALSAVPVPVELNLNLRVGWANALPSMDSLVQCHNKKWELCSHSGQGLGRFVPSVVGFLCVSLEHLTCCAESENGLSNRF